MLPQSRARQTKASFAVLTAYGSNATCADDHEALQAAVARAPCCTFISWNRTLAPGDLDLQHARFIEASLSALDQDLRARGAGLWVRNGDAVAVPEDLRRKEGMTH